MKNLGAGSAPENPLLPLNPYGSALRALLLLVHATTMSSGPFTCRVMACVCGNQTHNTVRAMFFFFFLFNEGFFPEGKWAALGGSAIPRQPVAGTKQASFPQPSSKNQFNI